jgi:hypothetical protein
MMGSTSNALDKGGENFKKLYNDSDVRKRNRNGQTKSGYIHCLYLWNGTTKDLLILMDYQYSTLLKIRIMSKGLMEIL